MFGSFFFFGSTHFAFDDFVGFSTENICLGLPIDYEFACGMWF